MFRFLARVRLGDSPHTVRGFTPNRNRPHRGIKRSRSSPNGGQLSVTKSAFAAFLVLSVGRTPIAYPLLPCHLTLAASVTIGIPGFFLALAPSHGSYSSSGFLRELARFSLPAGTAAGLGVLSSYFFALNVLDLQVREARTVATTTLVLVGLYLILALEAEGRRRSSAVGLLVALLFIGYAAVLFMPLHPDLLPPGGALGRNDRAGGRRGARRGSRTGST